MARKSAPRTQEELLRWIVQEIMTLKRLMKRKERSSRTPSEVVTFTPTINGSGLSLGNGSLTGRYVKTGKRALIEIQLVVGSTTTVSGDIQFTSPLALLSGFTQMTGSGRLQMGGTMYDVVTLAANNLLYCRFRRVNGSNVVQSSASATIPAAWAAGTMLASFDVLLD